MATGEIINAEELGGAKIHASTTGLADQIATDEYVILLFRKGRSADFDVRFDALRKAREWISSLPLPLTQALAPNNALPPRYSAEDLFSLVNPDIRKPFDMKEVLLRIVDDSRLSLFKPRYGQNLCTAWASIMGNELSSL